MNLEEKKRKIAFGGGCHWCTEAVFDALAGVVKVEQGWISSSTPEASVLSEAVIVHFDPEHITLARLIEIHLRTHQSTSTHRFRAKYRSAIYTFSPEQSIEASKLLRQQQPYFPKTLITKIYPFAHFKRNEEKFLHYYRKNPNKPFCQRYIEPKFEKLLDHYGTELFDFDKELITP